MRTKTTFATVAALATGVMFATTSISAASNTNGAPSSANPSAVKESIMKRYNRKALGIKRSHRVRASKTAGDALFNLISATRPFDFSDPSYIKSMQEMVNQYNCPTGFRCRTGKTKTSEDGVLGADSAAKILEATISHSRGRIFAWNPGQMLKLLEKLEGHPKERTITRKIVRLYTKTLSKLKSKYETTAPKATQIFPLELIQISKGVKETYKHYKLALKFLEKRDQDTTSAPSLLKKTAYGEVPSLESINEEAAILAMRKIIKPLNNLYQYASLRDRPENKAVFDDILQMVKERIQLAMGTENYNKARKLEMRLKLSCLKPGACQEASIPSAAPKFG